MFVMMTTAWLRVPRAHDCIYSVERKKKARDEAWKGMTGGRNHEAGLGCDGYQPGVFGFP